MAALLEIWKKIKHRQNCALMAPGQKEKPYMDRRFSVFIIPCAKPSFKGFFLFDPRPSGF